MKSIIDDFSLKAKEYLDKIDTRNVFPSAQSIDDLKKLNVPLQDESIHPSRVLDELYEIGSPATVASTGKRYFGFVIGGSLPAALAANLLAAYGIRMPDWKWHRRSHRIWKTCAKNGLLSC